MAKATAESHALAALRARYDHAFAKLSEAVLELSLVAHEEAKLIGSNPEEDQDHHKILGSIVDKLTMLCSINIRVIGEIVSAIEPLDSEFQNSEHTPAQPRIIH